MRALIVRQRRLTYRRFLLELEVPKRSFTKAVPGQFVHVRIEDSCDPLLRRPLSIHDIIPSRKGSRSLLKIVYEVVGKGTELLSEKQAGSPVDILGPLGRGFDVRALARAKRIILVAGGMGVAPLYFLARRLVGSGGRRSEVAKPIVLIGARARDHLVGEKAFKDLRCRVRVATDDGSKGAKGFVTDLLEKELPEVDRRVAAVDGRPGAVGGCGVAVCACGPKPMLAAVSSAARAHGVPAHVSLEEFMGCGLGACLGCAVRTVSGYRRICHDGPVFDAADIAWE